MRIATVELSILPFLAVRSALEELHLRPFFGFFFGVGFGSGLYVFLAGSNTISLSSPSHHSSFRVREEYGLLVTHSSPLAYQ